MVMTLDNLKGKEYNNAKYYVDYVSTILNNTNPIKNEYCV
ncbi:hypothetical protein MBFIL_19280 [Methanobrevibacter filiformis]|uniref:Uncharacterized protein n=1 Tax=Methanobrevibacter filiformis TaxID=55758 RepID=A0A165YYK4_9EURY|nr:hypothetical protein MBFIL_19280 [Methanobrevibacter filiformis]